MCHASLPSVSSLSTKHADVISVIRNRDFDNSSCLGNVESKSGLFIVCGFGDWGENCDANVFELIFFLR